MRSRRLVALRLVVLLLPAWAAVAAGSELDDPNQRAASSPSRVLCEAGHYLTTDCYMGQAVGCCPCPAGFFRSHLNTAESCLPCTPCREDQEMVSECTPTRDRQCRCKTGEYYCDSEHCPESCYRCTSCPGATRQTCNATRDTVCAPVAPAESGPAVSALSGIVVLFYIATIIAIVAIGMAIVAIAWWYRRGMPLPQCVCRFTTRTHFPCAEGTAWASRKSVSGSAEPGSHGYSLGSVQLDAILQTTVPERGPPPPDAETTWLMQEEAFPRRPMPDAQTRLGHSADPDPDPDLDPGAGAELQVEVAGGGREALELALPTPDASVPGAQAWAEAAAGLHSLEQPPIGPYELGPEVPGRDWSLMMAAGLEGNGCGMRDHRSPEPAAAAL